MVTYLPRHRLYVAVFDYLSDEATSFGFAYSRDGLVWHTPAQKVAIEGGCRAPLGLLVTHPLDETHLTLYYSRWSSDQWEEVWSAQAVLEFV